MLPTLAPGDYVLIDPSAPAPVGAVVIARHPYDRSRELVKRVAAIDPEGRLRLLGDNPEASTDSRSFSDVPADRLIGVVVARMPGAPMPGAPTSE
jgi:nickel-type superoxide dismutase maturation protease